MNFRVKIFSSFISIVVMSSFCLLQSHSYALAEVATPELPTPVKSLKNFSVIGTVSEIASSYIKLEKANGSDGTKNGNYLVKYHSPMIENQSYESLNISNVSIGDRIIAQGGIDKENITSPMLAKRIIVFSREAVLDNLVKIDNASTTASSTDELNISTSTQNELSESTTATTSLVSSDNFDGHILKEEVMLSSATTSSLASTSPLKESMTTTTSFSDSDMSTSTESEEEESELINLVEDENSSSTSSKVDETVNPNDKNNGVNPVNEDPDPIDSGSPIVSTPARDDDSVIPPESLPEPEPESKPEIEPEPDLISPVLPVSEVPIVSEAPLVTDLIVSPNIDLTPVL